MFDDTQRLFLSTSDSQRLTFFCFDLLVDENTTDTKIHEEAFGSMISEGYPSEFRFTFLIQVSTQKTTA